MFDDKYLSSDGVTEIFPNGYGALWLNFKFAQATKICCIELVGGLDLPEDTGLYWNFAGGVDRARFRVEYSEGIAGLSAGSIILYDGEPEWRR